MAHICLIEDDPIMGESLVDRFHIEGFSLDWFTRGEAALDALAKRPYDAVVSDVRLPDLSGEEVFLRIADRAKVPPFLFITAFASVERAVAMLHRGAYDYITKPFDIGELVSKVQVAVGDVSMHATPGESSVLGPSPSMRNLASLAPRVAARARTVLITGESGVGKEVLARHLHALSGPSTDSPFIAVNCGAIPETLIEASFFGHERGAYTGAERARKGYFEQAHGGTLLLDEIGDLPPAMQIKLLRVLQDRVVQRLGSEQTTTLNVRVICATHQDLRALVEQARFREDLYYRVAVVHLHVPPLRERPEDIIWLAQSFLAEQGRQLGEAPRSLGPSARSAMLAHLWPGNARELRNRIECACVLSPHAILGAADLFEGAAGAGGDAERGLPTLEAFVSDAERSYLQSVLGRFEGRIGIAAAALGISRKTLWEKMRRYAMRGTESH